MKFFIICISIAFTSLVLAKLANNANNENKIHEAKEYERIGVLRDVSKRCKLIEYNYAGQMADFQCTDGFPSMIINASLAELFNASRYNHGEPEKYGK